MNYTHMHRRGFTLVEVVVALGLGAMLMVSLVGVLRGVDRQLDIAEAMAMQDWQTSVCRVLQRDLMLASKIGGEDGMIVLEGSFPIYGSASAAPAKRVVYQCVPGLIGDSHCLVRVADDRGEPLGSGLVRILVERVDSSGVAQPLSKIPTAMSGQVRVWIWESDAMAPTLERDFVLR